MTEQERIKQMVEDGKISREEADLLLETLDEVDEAEEQADAALHDAGQSAASSAGSAPAASPAPEGTPPDPPAPPAPPASPAAERHAPATGPAADLHWVRIEKLAGDLEVSVDKTLSEPKVVGKAEVSKSGHDFTIRQERQKNLIGGLMSMGDDLELRIPEGYGVDLRLMAGDVEISGVPYLKGNLLAGDVDAFDIGGVNLDMKSGDLDISLKVTAGEHRINALAGDIDVQILPGSSVKVKSEVMAGDVDAPFEVERKMVGSRAEGVVGDGVASLDIRMKAGSLHLGVKGE